MSLSIFYKGNLKKPDEVQTFCDTVAEYAKTQNWQAQISDKDNGIIVDIPDCEPFRFCFEKGRVDTWAKYFGKSKEQLEQVFLFLWSIKPFFKKLMVSDDEGWWNDFEAKQKNEKFPPFRELKDIELAEYNRGFDLPKDAPPIFQDYYPMFPMGNTPTVLMKMVQKDMSPHLNNPLSKEDLFVDIDSRIMRFGPPDEKLEDAWENTQFQAVVDNWILKKLVNKDGANYGESYIEKSKGYNDWLNFSWLMRETIYSAFGGTLGPKHGKVQRFVEKLLRDGYSLEDDIVFLRLVYSVLEYSGIYRPAALIERTQ